MTYETYIDQIEEVHTDEMVSVNTSIEYPYDSQGRFIRRDAEHPYPLNIRLIQPGEQLIFAFKTDHLTTLSSFEIVKVVNDDVRQTEFELKYSFSIDDINWTPFMYWADFQLALAPIFGASLRVNTRVMLDTYREELDTDETTPNDSNSELIIDMFKWNGSESWIDGTTTKFYIPVAVEMPRSIGLNRDVNSLLFNPYAGYEKALEIQKSTAKAINDMVGHWVYWFRVKPDMDSASAIFRQYRLRNVVEMKKIKVLIPGNRLPSNRNTFSEWGIAFAEEFKMDVLNEVFEIAFGEDEFPSSGDFVWVPITNRMYTVVTATEIKKFMYKSVHSECILSKYEDRADTDDTLVNSDLLEYIEFMSEGKTEVAEKREVETATPSYLDLRRYESTRTFVHQNLQLTNNALTFIGNELFKNMYLTNAIDANTIAVSYNVGELPVRAQSFSFWFIPENVVHNRKIADIGASIKLEMLASKLRFSVGVRAVSITLEPGKVYYVAATFSTIGNFMALLVNRFDEQESEFVNVGYEFESMPTVETISEVHLYGGKQLFGFIRLTNSTVDLTNLLNHVMNVQPTDVKLNVLVDKCTPFIKQSRSLI